MLCRSLEVLHLILEPCQMTGVLFTPGSSPAYLFEVVFVKCVCI